MQIPYFSARRNRINTSYATKTTVGESADDIILDPEQEDGRRLWLTWGPTTPGGPGGPVLPWNPWNKENKNRAVIQTDSGAFGWRAEYSELLLLTVSPLCPGCPGSPSFPAGPWEKHTKYEWGTQKGIMGRHWVSVQNKIIKITRQMKPEFRPETNNLLVVNY